MLRLKPIFPTAPSDSTNDAQTKSGRKQLKNNHLASNPVTLFLCMIEKNLENGQKKLKN